MAENLQMNRTLQTVLISQSKEPGEVISSNNDLDTVMQPNRVEILSPARLAANQTKLGVGSRASWCIPKFEDMPQPQHSMRTDVESTIRSTRI